MKAVVIIFALAAILMAAKKIYYSGASGASRAINENKSMMIDKNTRFDGSESLNNILIMKYTMVNHDKSEIDVKYFSSRLKSIILDDYCGNPKYYDLRNKGVSLLHQYSDKNGKMIFEISTDRSKCKQLTKQS